MTLSSFIKRSHDEKEYWRYTDLETLLTKVPRPALASIKGQSSGLPKLSEAIQLVFVNGIFQPKSSHFGAIPSCILMGDLETGYKLTLGEHTCLITQPVELVFATDASAPTEISLRFSIDVGANGRLTLLENHILSSVVTTVETDVTLHERAKFVHGKIVQNNTHLAMTNVTIASGGYYNNFSLLRGGLPTRNEINVHLNGQQAQATLNGAMLLRENQHADTTTCITHSAPNCASRQVYKTVLDDKSKGVFQGKVVVAQDAQKTDGYQLSRALLLSDQAEMDAKPELEINADDVKCSHGSTVGDLDENALFYLRARGLSETQARALLIDAFVVEMLDEIQVEEWREIIRQEIAGWSR
jgi:Fe-S cluster assembly protein SufD